MAFQIDLLLARNTTPNWASGVALPWRCTSPRGGCLVDPSHVVFSGHYPLVVGQPVTFASGQKRVVSRAVIHPLRRGYYRDIGMARLDKPVSITPPGIASLSSMLKPQAPLLAVQGTRNTVVDVVHYSDPIIVMEPADARRRKQYIPAESGQSGQPVFHITPTKVYLAGLYSTWFCDDGTLCLTVPKIIAELKAALSKP